MLSKHLNGQKDLNFGQNGLVTVDLGTSQSYPYCIAEQDDGKIIFIGSSAIGNLIYRFNSDGTKTLMLESPARPYNKKKKHTRQWLRER